MAMIADMLLFILPFVVIGLALDAAFFWRFSNLLGIFYKPVKNLKYGHFAFPRLVFVVLSCVVIGYGSYQTPPDSLFIISGMSVFLLSALYPHLILFRNSDR